jgi:ribonuclease P protein component
MKASKSLYFRDLSFKYSKISKPEMGLIVSKKYGNAVQRNLFKRRCRSIFKSIIVDRDIGYALVVRPKKRGVTYISIKESFNSVYDKLSN